MNERKETRADGALPGNRQRETRRRARAGEDVGSLTRVARHVWLAVAFIFLWLHFSYVQPHVRHQDWQLYTLYFLAVAGVAARYLTGIWYGRLQWHRTMFDALTILLMGLGVNLTGGIYSELWLVYFVFVIVETLAAPPRGFLITDAAAIASYVVATWPQELTPVYLELLFTRIFFLVLVASIARTIAGEERRRQEHLAALREALSISEERRRLARDLHDGIGHTLTQVILGLEVTRRQCPVDPPAAAEAMQQHADALRGAMTEMRQIVATLRADTGAIDVRTIVRGLAAQLAENASLQVDVRMSDGPLPLSPHRQYHLARVIQEALTNCLRHSGAPGATVAVGTSPDGLTVYAEITDRGSGFAPGAAAELRGQGLRGMQERIAPYGGHVSVVSTPGEGTEVRVTLPADLPQNAVLQHVAARIEPNRHIRRK
jgi:signal transduction histidine kinase